MVVVVVVVVMVVVVVVVVVGRGLSMAAVPHAALARGACARPVRDATSGAASSAPLSRAERMALMPS